MWYIGIYLYEDLIQSLIQVRYENQMLNIYCRRRTLNDRYLYNEDMSQKEIDLIQQVDEAKLTPDKHIETKYGLGTI